MKTIRILGTRGVPASHGGFETFAEYLSLYLVRRGWRVIVYCQEKGSGPIFNGFWEGVECVYIPVPTEGSFGTILFDLKSILHASSHRDLCLTLGYNTAIFCVFLRLRGVCNLINMDGIEWRRQKWGLFAKFWFWLNDWLGCWLGNHLIADNPGIFDHLVTRVNRNKITTIPYGADRLIGLQDKVVYDFGLKPGQYWTVIARPEPENSLLEIVKAFSNKRRGVKLVVLGRYSEDVSYHCAVRGAASDEVVFLGAIYDASVVKALRFFCAGYIHGHQVGGTNPSLVEAMGAHNAILAHDNRFNRWVAGESALYFTDEKNCADLLDSILVDDRSLKSMSDGTFMRFEKEFTWTTVLEKYEALLEKKL